MNTEYVQRDIDDMKKRINELNTFVTAMDGIISIDCIYCMQSVIKEWMDTTEGQMINMLEALEDA